MLVEVFFLAQIHLLKMGTHFLFFFLFFLSFSFSFFFFFFLCFFHAFLFLFFSLFLSFFLSFFILFFTLLSLCFLSVFVSFCILFFHFFKSWNRKAYTILSSGIPNINFKVSLLADMCDSLTSLLHARRNLANCFN